MTGAKMPAELLDPIRKRVHTLQVGEFGHINSAYIVVVNGRTFMDRSAYLEEPPNPTSMFRSSVRIERLSTGYRLFLLTKNPTTFRDISNKGYGKFPFRYLFGYRAVMDIVFDHVEESLEKSIAG